jgi:hypothetical protein
VAAENTRPLLSINSRLWKTPGDLVPSTESFSSSYHLLIFQVFLWRFDSLQLHHFSLFFRPGRNCGESHHDTWSLRTTCGLNDHLHIRCKTWIVYICWIQKFQMCERDGKKKAIQIAVTVRISQWNMLPWIAYSTANNECKLTVLKTWRIGRTKSIVSNMGETSLHV